jgi:hypothetical protein
MKIIDTLTDGTQTYEQRTELDGQEYVLAFQWNDRRGLWAFGITGVDGTAHLTGQTVTLLVPLNRRAVGGPPGVFVAQPETDDHTPPGLLDLGARVKLVYLDQAGGAELPAADDTE